MKTTELTGYLYIKENGYDQFYVNELYLVDDTSNVFYKDLSQKSNRSSFLSRSHPNFNPEEAVIKEGRLLVDIVQEKLDLKPGSVEFKHIRNNKDGWLDTLHTFDPDRRKVRITIEELED